MKAMQELKIKPLRTGAGLIDGLHMGVSTRLQYSDTCAHNTLATLANEYSRKARNSILLKNSILVLDAALHLNMQLATCIGNPRLATHLQYLYSQIC